MQKFIDEDTECPDIGLRAVEIVNQSLWTHVERTPYRHISKVRGRFNGETKVSYLEVGLSQEDITDLDVSVDNSKGGQISQGLEDGEDYFGSCGFVEGSRLLQGFVEISSRTELSDDIAIIGTEVNIQAVDNIWVFHLPEDIDFPFQESPGDFAAHISYSHFFDSHGAVVVDVSSSVDTAEASFSYFFPEVEDVVFDFFENLSFCWAVGLFWLHEISDRLMFIYNACLTTQIPLFSDLNKIISTSSRPAPIFYALPSFKHKYDAFSDQNTFPIRYFSELSYFSLNSFQGHLSPNQAGLKQR